VISAGVAPLERVIDSERCQSGSETANGRQTRVQRKVDKRVSAVLIARFEGVVFVNFENDRRGVVDDPTKVLGGDGVIDGVRCGEVEEGDEGLVRDCAVMDLQGVGGVGNAAKTVEYGRDEGVSINVSDSSASRISEGDPFMEVCEIHGLRKERGR